MVSVRFAVAVVIGMLLAGHAGAQGWQQIHPAAAGWSVERLEAAKGQSEKLKPAALMIVQDGKVVARWGDPFRKVGVASVRKSLRHGPDEHSAFRGGASILRWFVAGVLPYPLTLWRCMVRPIRLALYVERELTAGRSNSSK